MVLTYIWSIFFPLIYIVKFLHLYTECVSFEPGQPYLLLVILDVLSLARQVGELMDIHLGWLARPGPVLHDSPSALPYTLHIYRSYSFLYSFLNTHSLSVLFASSGSLFHSSTTLKPKLPSHFCHCLLFGYVQWVRRLSRVLGCSLG